ncbi:MAG: ATP-binding cassette domain-containing protein [Myxococcota bacterium]
MDNCSLSYGERQVLHSVSFRIEPGETIGFVGASGSGKSSMIRALIGLYTASGRSIRYDDVPVEEIGWDVVRSNITTVLQTPALFNDSIRNNLITFHKTVDDDRLWWALRTAQLEGDIRRLDDGLDSIIGRNGVRLSGGQRQRLAIARALLTSPRLIIFDEATSALDVKTEQRVLDGVFEHFADRTIILIAHRANTLKTVDRLIEFEKGRVKEISHHEQALFSPTKGLTTAG